jgi:alkylation response protein AidB-like acyl-CoA dehydrogenase
MDFDFSEEQELLRKTARDVLTQNASTKAVRAAMDRPDCCDRELWRQLAELGWTGLAIPEPLGGSDLGPVELGVVLEELGRALAPVPFLPTQMAARAVLEGGDAAQRERWLPPLAAGDQMATFATTEAHTGHDPCEVQLRATRTGQGWQLQGAKWFVPDARIADWIVVSARTGEAPAAVGLFVVPRSTPGLRVTPLESIDPLREPCRIDFDAVSVPGDAYLSGSANPQALRATLDHALAMIAAEMLGGAQRCLDDSVAHAKQREQFGKPIGAYQAIKHQCADMLFQVESSRSVTYYAAWALGAGNPDATLAAAMAKAYVSDAYRHVSGQNIQIHGGVGFTWEYDCHLLFKRARSDEVWLGDARYHRERVAQLLDI